MIGIKDGLITRYVESTMDEQCCSADDRHEPATYDTARSVNDIKLYFSMSFPENRPLCLI